MKIKDILKYYDLDLVLNKEKSWLNDYLMDIDININGKFDSMKKYQVEVDGKIIDQYVFVKKLAL